MRKVIFVLALLVVALGASQIAFLGWWLNATRTMVESPWYRLLGLVSLFFGVVVLIAVAKRLVGLRGFMAALGLLMAFSGFTLLVSPDFGRDLTYAALLNRAPGAQVALMWVSGLVRIGLGAAILYALATRTPRASEARPGAPGSVD